MPKQHELLAAEKTTSSAWTALQGETLKKLNNEHFFQGHVKSLHMLEESIPNKAIEAAAAEVRKLPTNVFDTFDYALSVFARHENLQAQKNLTNTRALADIYFDDEVLLANVPVDELLGLETRVTKIRELIVAIPTLDATKNWTRDANLGCWVAPPEETTKTDKVMTPVRLAAATDKHPEQVEKVTKDVPIGLFTLIRHSGAATAVQKADAIQRVDKLLVELKQARMRANETPVADAPRVGDIIKDLLLRPLAQQ